MENGSEFGFYVEIEGVKTFISDFGYRPKPKGHTAFFKDISSGNFEKVEKRIKDNPLILGAYQGNDKKPLQIACKNGHLNIAELLLENNVRVDAIDWLGKTALYEAAEQGHLKVVKCLVNKWNANPNIYADGNYGLLPLFVAKGGSQGEIFKFLKPLSVRVDREFNHYPQAGLINSTLPVQLA